MIEVTLNDLQVYHQCTLVVSALEILDEKQNTFRKCILNFCLRNLIFPCVLPNSKY
jgi:hypothetical protein